MEDKIKELRRDIDRLTKCVDRLAEIVEQLAKVHYVDGVEFTIS